MAKKLNSVTVIAQGGGMLPVPTYNGPDSPDAGSAQLWRSRRWPGALAGEEGLRSATMVLRGGKLREGR